jgi:energy-coupling factor transporter ATP-binding protein EcfA2
MHPEFSAFLRLLLPVTSLSLDQAEFALAEEDGGGRPAEVVSPLCVTREDFFTQLYEERKVVAQLSKNLNRDTNLLCLVGPSGCGKSTVVRMLQRELEQRGAASGLPKSFVTIIDLRMERSKFDLTNAYTIERSLRVRLKMEYLDRIFPFTRKGDNPRLRLWAFLLDPDTRDLKLLPAFQDLRLLQDSATRLLTKWDRGHPEQSTTVAEWLAIRAGEPEVDEVTAKADDVLDFPHLVHAAHHVGGITQQIVWLDNVDTLSDMQQTDAMIAIRRVFTPVASLVHMGISIREENVFRDYELSDEGAPPVGTRVLVEMPFEPNAGPFYPATDIPVATEEILRGIIVKRLLFTRKYQADKVGSLNTQLRETDQLLARSTQNNETELKRDEIILKKEKIESELMTLTPTISAQRFASLEELSRKLLDSMADMKAIFLANNSLREFMFIVRDCLADLLRSNQPEDGGRIRALDYEGWYISTLFLRRIRHSMRIYRIGVYDVLADNDKWFNDGKKGIGCLLSHLILTATWNLLLQGAAHHGFPKRPRVSDIVQRLGKLGYGREEIVRGLHELYFHNNRRQNLLEIRWRTELRSWEEVGDNMEVYLTYRGKCLTSCTTGSFGYLYDCLRLLHGGSPDEGMLIDHQQIRSTAGVINSLLPILCDVAEMHYQAFKNWRTKGVLSGGKWLQEYRSDFGIPCVEPYRRRGGKPLLQLELILNSLSSYVRDYPEEARKLGRLLGRYQEALDALGNADAATVEPDFRHYMGQSPREKKVAA